MHTQQQRFPWQATLLLVFAVAPIIAGVISFSSSLSLIGKPSIGILPIWQDAIRCNAVSPITPPSWPAMTDGSLQTGDCIETIGGVSAYHWPLSEIERYADAKDGRNLVDVGVRRGAERFSVQVIAFRLNWLHVLQLQFGILPVTLFVWMLALIVLLEQPGAETNQASAALFLVLALAIVGLYHGLNDEQGRYYTAFTIVSSMAWIGPFLYHLALLTPRPLARYAYLRFALHPVGLAAMILHLDSMLAFVPLLRPWRSETPGLATMINGVTMLIGLGTFLLRAGWWAWRGDRALSDQMRVLLLSWGLGAGPLNLASAYYLLTYRAPLGTSFQPFLFFLVILCSGNAYVMLRYQHFASRRRVLDSLAMLYISATIACAVMVVVLIGVFRMPVDGLVFMALMHIRAQIQRLLAVPALRMTAQEQERERIAREIHDGVMPFLGASPSGMAQIQRHVQAGDPVDETLSVCETYQKRAIKTAQELRAIMRRQQPPLVGATRLGLAIQAFTEEICTLYNVPRTINGAGIAYPLDDATARQAYRIIHQAVVNALQHAHPRLLQVTITTDEHGWECVVSDDGKGFDPNQPQRHYHFGLFSMHERARTINAALTIDSQPGRGTTVRLRLSKASKIEDETRKVIRYPLSVER